MNSSMIILLWARLRILLAVYLVIGVACSKKDPYEGLINKPGKGVSDLDGHFYKSVIIGYQEWMTSNLRSKHYADGSDMAKMPDGDDLLPDDYKPFYRNIPFEYVEDINSEAQMFDRYGLIYNWYAATDPRGVCPAGWRVPFMEDFEELLNYVRQFGMYGAELASTERVNHPRWGECARGYTNNRLGLNVYPDPLFGNLAFYWLATPRFRPDEAFYGLFECAQEYGLIMGTSFGGKRNYLAIRCIRSSQ